MELAESIKQIAKRYEQNKSAIKTEEATKTSLIMPFIAALGYDIYNPKEVVPEYSAEINGIKKGEKVDYVINKDDEPTIMIECKHHESTLEISQESQLMRYFNALTSNEDIIIAILTNGVVYKFYADLDEQNKMDSKPFLQFDITSMSEVHVKELSRFSKSAFDIDTILPAAEELKYTGAIKKILVEAMTEPDEAFVRALAKQVYDGMMTEKKREEFKCIVRKAFSQFINDRINDRLKIAAAQQEEQDVNNEGEDDEEEGDEEDDNSSRIVTTQEEIEGYSIIKSILRNIVPPKRIAMRDTISYCGILLDDNNRKPICRLLFNNPDNMSIVLFDASKNKTKFPIKEVDDLYGLSDKLIANIKTYLEAKDDSTVKPNE